MRIRLTNCLPLALSLAMVGSLTPPSMAYEHGEWPPSSPHEEWSSSPPVLEGGEDKARTELEATYKDLLDDLRFGIEEKASLWEYRVAREAYEEAYEAHLQKAYETFLSDLMDETFLNDLINDREEHSSLWKQNVAKEAHEAAYEAAYEAHLQAAYQDVLDHLTFNMKEQASLWKQSVAKAKVSAQAMVTAMDTWATWRDWTYGTKTKKAYEQTMDLLDNAGGIDNPLLDTDHPLLKNHISGLKSNTSWLTPIMSRRVGTIWPGVHIEAGMIEIKKSVFAIYDALEKLEASCVKKQLDVCLTSYPAEAQWRENQEEWIQNNPVDIPDMGE